MSNFGTSGTRVRFAVKLLTLALVGVPTANDECTTFSVVATGSGTGSTLTDGQVDNQRSTGVRPPGAD